MLRLLALSALLLIGSLAQAAVPRHASPSDPPPGALASPTPAAAIAPADRIDDGPFLFRRQDHIEARWVCGGTPVIRRIALATGPTQVEPVCGYPRTIELALASATAPSQLPDSAERIAALSDVHGQYPLLLALLQAQGIVDADGNWGFANGQLVVTGDAMDRGPQVTEVLWLLYSLKQQAQVAGGGVHFLIGNHEAMVLAGDLRYLHDKYVRSASLLGSSYDALYSADSVLGGWLRQRATLLRGGGMLFLHGGIHARFLDLGLDLDQANQRFRESLGLARAQLAQDPLLAALHDGSFGPLWYRGYFLDPGLEQDEVDRIATALGVERIVVGHTSHTRVESFFNGRVIAIDSSLKEGVSGELLRWEGGELRRGGLDGRQHRLLEVETVEP